MFTGIVTARGQIVERTPRGADLRLRVAWPGMPAVATGDSVCVSGACLTALEISDSAFSADVSAETARLTILGSARVGAEVNLEPALAVGDRLGGHFVTGHVDGLARLQSRRTGDGSEVFVFDVPGHLMQYLAPKGSVTVDGVSLTVNEVGPGGFAVTMIPHTLEATTLGLLAEGDEVNLEVDLLARYMERLLAERGPAA